MDHKSFLLVFAVFLILLPAALAKDYEITVVDKNENPIDNAQVMLLGKSDEVKCNETTKKEGIVTCESIASEKDYTIRVTHEDYARINDDSALEDLSYTDEMITVVMRPKKDYKLEVSVLNEYGKPMSNAKVQLRCVDKDLNETTFEKYYDIIIFPNENPNYEGFRYDDVDETGSSGTADFKELEYNAEYELMINKTNYKTIKESVVMPDSAGDESVEFEMFVVGSGQLTAKIVDGDNKPVSGVSVNLISKSSGQSWSAVSGDDGGALIVVSTPDTFEITLESQNYYSEPLKDIYIANKDKKQLIIPVSQKNKPPIANAGKDRVVAGELTLDASKSSDPEGDELGYSWTEEEIILSTEETFKTIFPPGEHTIILTVTDSVGQSSQDTVIITVEEETSCGNGICEEAEQDDPAMYCATDCDLGEVEEKDNEITEPSKDKMSLAKPMKISSEDANWIMLIVAIALVLFAIAVVRKIKGPKKKGLRALRY